MLGTGKKDVPRYIDPKGFVDLYLKYATVDCIYRAQEVADEFMRSKPNRGDDELFYFMSLLGAVFEAGRMQGMREVRMKHI